MFALVDCNNFYASCERVFRPELNGKPVAILSNNDGCVIARSNEAKAVGVPMGAPYFKYKKLMKQHKVHVFSSNYPLYGDMSARVMNILNKMSPEIEIYSIDEAFLKFESCDYLNLEEHGALMRDKVTQSTGIPISIGFAPTKGLSKVANRIAKKFPKQTKGVYVMDTEEKRIKALKWIEIADVWGIGRANAKKLELHGVTNGYEFSLLPDNWVKKNMSIVGLRLKKDLQGIPTLDLDEKTIKKNIATTRSFDRDYLLFEEVEERIATFAITCAEKLRKQHSCCKQITIFVRSNRHKKEEAQYRNSVTLQIPFPTHSSIDLVKYAKQALQMIFKEGYRYKKAGVIVSGLSPQEQRAYYLFDETNTQHEKLMSVMDKINVNSSNKLLKLASQDLKKTWKMNQNFLSPNFSTKLKDVIVIK